MRMPQSCDLGNNGFVAEVYQRSESDRLVVRPPHYTALAKTLTAPDGGFMLLGLSVLAAGGIGFILGRLWEACSADVEPERGHLYEVPPQASVTRRQW